MSINLGLMLRIDSFPLAVAVPPLPQGFRSLAPALVAEKVVEPTAVLQMKAFNGALGGGYAASTQPQMLTYSRHGTAATALQPSAGRLFDAYV